MQLSKASQNLGKHNHWYNNKSKVIKSFVKIVILLNNQLPIWQRILAILLYIQCALSSGGSGGGGGAIGAPIKLDKLCFLIYFFYQNA